jgi:hypothetical protein
MKFAIANLIALTTMLAFSAASVAAPLILDWVPTKAPTASRPDITPVSISATLTLADDLLLAEGSFVDQPPTQSTAVPNPAYLRRSSQLSFSGIYISTVGSVVPNSTVYSQSIDLLNWSLSAFAPGSCFSAACYAIDLRADPALGVGKFSGNVYWFNSITNERFQAFSNGSVALSVGDLLPAVGYDVAGYWQARAPITTVPLPSSLFLMLLALAAMCLNIKKD